MLVLIDAVDAGIELVSLIDGQSSSGMDRCVLCKLSDNSSSCPPDCLPTLFQLLARNDLMPSVVLVCC